MRRVNQDENAYGEPMLFPTRHQKSRGGCIFIYCDKDYRDHIDGYAAKCLAAL